MTGNRVISKEAASDTLSVWEPDLDANGRRASL
jgi:hypothetical protein